MIANELVHILILKRKNEANIQPSWLNKLIWLSGIFFLRNTVGRPERDSSILPARVANHSAGFDSFCPLTELAI